MCKTNHNTHIHTSTHMQVHRINANMLLFLQEYLQLQLLVDTRYPTESFSSEQNSPTDSPRVSSGVFEDNSENDDQGDIQDDIIDANVHLVREGIGEQPIP